MVGSRTDASAMSRADCRRQSQRTARPQQGALGAVPGCGCSLPGAGCTMLPHLIPPTNPHRKAAAGVALCTLPAAGATEATPPDPSLQSPQQGRSKVRWARCRDAAARCQLLGAGCAMLPHLIPPPPQTPTEGSLASVALLVARMLLLGAEMLLLPHLTPPPPQTHQAPHTARRAHECRDAAGLPLCRPY
jgi:hypothetical protein